MPNPHDTLLSDSVIRSPRLSPRAAAGSVSLALVGLGMIAAAVIVVVGEKDAAVSLSLWNTARIVCQVVAGVLGLAMLVSPVILRDSHWSLKEILSTVAWGGILVAAAVVGLGLVLVVTGFLGLGLAAAGVTTIAGAFRPRQI